MGDDADIGTVAQRAALPLRHRDDVDVGAAVVGLGHLGGDLDVRSLDERGRGQPRERQREVEVVRVDDVVLGRVLEGQGGVEALRAVPVPHLLVLVIAPRVDRAQGGGGLRVARGV